MDQSKIQQLFDVCDLNASGYIEYEDLRELCLGNDLEISDVELGSLFDELDKDGDGRITVDEFQGGFHSVEELLRQKVKGVGGGERSGDRVDFDDVKDDANASITPKRTSYGRSNNNNSIVKNGKATAALAAWQDLMTSLGPGASLLQSQDQVCDLYQQLHSSEVPHLLRQFEAVIYDVIKDLRQRNSEIDRLEKSLKRSNDSNAEHLKQLEYEMEIQVTKTEQRVRKEERERVEAEKTELRTQLESEISELKSNLNQIHNAEDRVVSKERPREDLLHSMKKDMEQIRGENRTLRSSLTEAQTNLALSRSELVTLKSDYDDQLGFITNNRDVIQEYISEQDKMSRQIQLLHEANKKLQDTNDDLRAALDTASRSSRMSPRTTRLLSSASYMNDYMDEAFSAESSRRRKAFVRQGSYDGTEMQVSGGRRQFVYPTADGDNYPDDGDSGNSTLRDPNELDSETEEDIRRAPPLREEIAVSMKQELLQAQRQTSAQVHTQHAAATSSQLPTNGRPASGMPVITSPYNEPITDSHGISRGSSPRSSSTSRKRTLPQLPQKPLSPTPPQHPERMYKIVLAGDAAVGKSSFIMRLCKGVFHNNLNSTLGVDFQMKTINIDDRVTSLQLWDTAGQERFRSIAKSYFRRADGVLLLYDCTFERSFINVRDWIEAIEDSAHKPVPVMICANKVDARPAAAAEGVRCVRTEDGQRLATSFNALFIETSAKDGSNIEDAVIELTRQLHKREDLEVGFSGMTLNTETPGKKKDTGCCDF
ncbi:ras and EF-hand domain-containing protein-like [Diadema antillarum]|uniref:ras and EF-hand domain-containing protein-like n=1 Tax=Diadema antillarum TaxID=105358 RepID=UPI003A855083